MSKPRITGEDPTPRQLVESLLPKSYNVSENITGVIRCTSYTGISTESKWSKFFEGIKEYFGESFKEVHHWTCYNHKDFTVYYSYTKLNNIDHEHRLIKPATQTP